MAGLLATITAGLFFLMGSIIAIFNKKSKGIISFSTSLSFIVLIWIVIFDILPEALELFNEYKFLSIGGGILIGLGILMLSDKFIPHHSHHDNIKKHHHHLIHIGIMTSIALIIHNIIEGICIYSVTKTSIKAGFSYAIAVGLHNLPFGINITTFMNEKKLVKMWSFNTLLILSTTIGALFIHLLNYELNSFFLGTLLSLTMGMIIYIVIWELLVEIKASFNKYSVWGILTGLLLMLIGILI